MNKKIFSRLWFYFRTGWGTYFAFLFSGINTLVVTYYLAIEEIPFLLEIFPSFAHYVAIVVIIAVPLLAAVGYVHFKRLPAYSSEVAISVEQNPYVFKLHPGWNKKVVFPMYRLMTIMLLKQANDEKLTPEEINDIKKIIADIEHLNAGGWIDKPRGTA